MKYMYQRLIPLLLLCMVLGLTGCQSVKRLVGYQKSDGTAESTGYNIYYISKDETKIGAVGYQLSSTTEEGIIQECLELLETAPDSKNYKAVIAEPVTLERYVYDKDARTLALYFDETYNKQSETTEMLTRAAIVKTLTQFGNIIDYVSFCIGDEWLADSDGSTMLMKNSDYVIEITSNLDHLDDATVQLYFASEDGTALVPVTMTMKYYNTSPLAYAVLDALIRGPVSEEGAMVLSSNTRVKSVYVKDGICLVDFNQGFLEKVGDQNFLLNVYSVVNSLTALDDINYVEITVDGQSVTDAPDGVVMTGDLSVRLNLVVH